MDRARSARLHAAVVAALAFVAYMPSLDNGFAFDDVVGIVDDERIRDPGNAVGLLTAPYLTHVPAERSPYRPLTTLSYVLSWAQGDGNPRPFHVLNVLAHVSVTAAVLSLLAALGAAPMAALGGAAVFAVHPVHVEAVANVVGRADVLAALFCILALRVHLSSMKAPVRVALVGVAYLGALGFKEGAVVLPGLLYTLDLARRAGRLGPAAEVAAAVPEPRGAVRAWAEPLVRAWPTYAALSVALAVFLVLRRFVLGGVVHLDVASYIVVLPAGLRVTTGVANLAEIARLLLVPLDLSPEYGPAVIVPAGLTSPRFWAGALVGASGLYVAVVSARRGGPGRWVAAGLGWFAVAFVLVSNVVLPLPMWIAERTLYLPSVGLCFVVVGVLHLVAERGIRARVPRGALAGLCLLGAVHSWNRSGVWDSDETLFTDLVERHPESFRAQWWLGGRMIDRGDLEGGTVWLARAVDTHPNSVLLTLDYARALLLAGRSGEAAGLVRPISPALHPSRAVYLAQSLIFEGREGEATEAVLEGLRYFPDDPRLQEQARELGIEP